MPSSKKGSAIISAAKQIEQTILLIRGQKVMLDRDLADLYGVETKQLKRAVRRNVHRFPPDFMFELTRKEYNSLRSQFGTFKRGAHSKYLPMAFTEQGVAMLSSVLNSERAIEVNIAIMRVFVKLRETTVAHQEMKRKLEKIEKQLSAHDEDIQVIFRAIQGLIKEPEKPRKRIGFEVKEPKAKYTKKKKAK